MQTYSQIMNSLHFALDIKIRQAYEMRHTLKLFNQICPRTATNIEETSPLLLQHVEHSLHDTLRMLLKLLSTGFPKAFNVAVILEGLRSDVPQVLSAIQVWICIMRTICGNALTNAPLPSRKSWRTSCRQPTRIWSYRFCFRRSRQRKQQQRFAENVCAAYYSLYSLINGFNVQMEKDTAAFFGGRSGVDVLLDALKNQKPDVELSSLALQYFLHIAADHAEFLDGGMKTEFETLILPQLAKSELTKELLIETYHG